MRMRLDEACASIADGDHQAPPKSDVGVPFITISCMDPNGGHLDFDSAAHVPEDYYDSLPANRKAMTGDVLLSVVGSLGIPYLVKPNDRFVFQRHIAIMRPGEIVFPEYLYYLLKSPASFHYIDSVAQGAAQRTLTLTQLRAMEVDIPTKEQQKRVLAHLEPYDNLIENNRRQIALLEEAAQRLYREWFVELHFPGHSNTQATDGIPDGWSIRTLTECCDVIRGRSYTSDEIDGDDGIALVNLKNLRSFGGWNDGAEKTYSGAFKDEQHVGAGDIIMGVTDMTKERRLVGHVALVPELGREAIISMDLVKLVPKAIERFYLYAVLRYSGIADNIALLANGTNVLHLKPQMLSSVLLTLPTKKLQNQFGSFMLPLVREIDLATHRIAQLAEARDRLLPKLMSGEIEVEG